MKPLTEEQFQEEFRVACRGLERKYNWHINTVRGLTAENGRIMVFDVDEIKAPVALPFEQFAQLVEECFYENGKTLCDELNQFLTTARKEVNRRN